MQTSSIVYKGRLCTELSPQKLSQYYSSWEAGLRRMHQMAIQFMHPLLNVRFQNYDLILHSMQIPSCLA